MEKKTTLKSLLQKGQLFAPCIYDCLSARAAELVGFKAILLSGGVLAYSMCGVPDIGLLSPDELIWATTRITDYSPLPLIVDAGNGYGESPLNTYHISRRLVKAGAMAVTIDDTTSIRGWERWRDQMVAGSKDGTIDYPVVSKETWLAKVKAGLSACEGTNCMLIARTDCKLKYGLDEAIERCVRARELGVEMTFIIGLENIEEAKKAAKYVSGWKIWPDIMSRNGVPNVELKDIEPLGFNLVTMHYLEKGAMFGMMDYARQDAKNRNAVYSEEHDFDGLLPEKDHHVLLSYYKKWIPMEEEFNDVET